MCGGLEDVERQAQEAARMTQLTHAVAGRCTWSRSPSRRPALWSGDGELSCVAPAPTVGDIGVLPRPRADAGADGGRAGRRCAIDGHGRLAASTVGGARRASCESPHDGRHGAGRVRRAVRGDRRRPGARSARSGPTPRIPRACAAAKRAQARLRARRDGRLQAAGGGEYRQLVAGVAAVLDRACRRAICLVAASAGRAASVAVGALPASGRRRRRLHRPGEPLTRWPSGMAAPQRPGGSAGPLRPGRSSGSALGGRGPPAATVASARPRASARRAPLDPAGADRRSTGCRRGPACSHAPGGSGWRWRPGPTPAAVLARSDSRPGARQRRLGAALRCARGPACRRRAPGRHARPACAAARPPQDVPAARVRDPAEDEQQVREPVEVLAPSAGSSRSASYRPAAPTRTARRGG